MAGEPPPCQQCRHDWHYSTTSPHTATWAQDYDDSYARTYTNIKTRRASLQAKIASFPSLGLMTACRENITLCTWPSPKLHIRVARAPFQGDGLSRLHSGSPSPLSYLFHSSCILQCKNFRAFKRGTRTRSFSKTGRRAPA
jgi:hypothetical protein